MQAADSDLLLTEARAAKLAGVSVRRLREWDQKQIVRPTYASRRGAKHVNFYGFASLVELLIAAQLRERVSLQHLRSVLDRIRNRGYENPLRQLVFAVAGEEIYYQEQDGSWEAGKKPGQGVIREVIPLEEIKARIRDGALADRSESAGKVESRRGIRASKPVFKDTRIPLEAVQRYIERGYTNEQILEAYPDLTQADIALAQRELNVSA